MDALVLIRLGAWMQKRFRMKENYEIEVVPRTGPNYFQVCKRPKMLSVPSARQARKKIKVETIHLEEMNCTAEDPHLQKLEHTHILCGYSRRVNILVVKMGGP